MSPEHSIRVPQLGAGGSLTIPHLGIGVASFGGCYGCLSEEECVKFVKYALKHGVEYFDTSPWYGQGLSEGILGKALNGVRRDRYFVSTKVGRYSTQVNEMFDFTYSRTLNSIDESLERLGLEYVDILFAHDVEFCHSFDQIVDETLPALDHLRKSGKTRYIGISGYTLEDLKKIVERSQVKCDCILTYARYTLFDKSLESYIDFFKARGIAIICGSPTGMGIMTLQGPPKWHPARTPLRESCQYACRLILDRGCDPAVLSLKSVLDHGGIDVVLAGPVGLEELDKCIKISDQKLTVSETDVIKEVEDLAFGCLAVDQRHWEGYEVLKYMNDLERFNDQLLLGGSE